MSEALTKRIQKQLVIMVFIVISMFGFCFALVPLYNVFCKVTGLNGKTANEAQPVRTEIDKNRIITVELLATLNNSLPDKAGEFDTKIKKFMIHPGEYITTSYWVKNLRNQPVVVQAIPSVTPGSAAQYVQKVECFCFQHQPLDAREGKQMPLKFTVSTELPSHIRTVTLAYTLFDVTP